MTTEPPDTRAGSDLLQALDPATRVIVGELAQTAAEASVEWSLAVNAARRDPELAMAHLAKVQVLSETSLAGEVKDLAKATQDALDALERQTEEADRPGPWPFFLTVACDQGARVARSPFPVTRSHRSAGPYDRAAIPPTAANTISCLTRGRPATEP